MVAGGHFGKLHSNKLKLLQNPHTVCWVYDTVLAILAKVNQIHTLYPQYVRYIHEFVNEYQYIYDTTCIATGTTALHL